MQSNIFVLFVPFCGHPHFDILRSLDDDTFIAEALLYPEVSRLGTNTKSLERSVVNNALQILEKESQIRLKVTLQNFQLREQLQRDELEDYLQDLIREMSLLELMAASLRSEVSSSQTLLTISCFDDQGRQACKRLRELYHALFEREFGCQPIKHMQPVGEAGSYRNAETLLLEGALAAQIASLEAGTHLFVSSSEGNIPIVVSACEMSDHALDSEKHELLPIIRIYSELESALDLRSRLLAKGKLGSAELRAFVLSVLSLPPEFVVT